jgi:AMP-binding enzyme C-terminal domain/Phosphopantetheine attachment site
MHDSLRCRVCRYVGRADAQVKLRGIRLELGEIEAVLAAVPGVQDAVVVLQDAHTPTAVLVAYVTPETADEAALLAAAHARLPHYMVPSAFVRLAELPRLPSGKAVHDAWQQTLHISEPVSVYANFFQMGGNSLQAGALCSRLRAVLGGEAAIPIVWVLECQTIEALAARLSDAGAMSALSALPPLVATVSLQDADGSVAAPLTYEQVRAPWSEVSADIPRLFGCCRWCMIWFAAALQEQFYQLWENAPDSSAYNSGFYLCLEGAVDLPMLQAAATMLFDRQQVGNAPAKGHVVAWAVPRLLASNACCWCASVACSYIIR